MAVNKNGQMYFTFEDMSFEELDFKIKKSLSYLSEKLEKNSCSKSGFKSLVRHNRLIRYHVMIDKVIKIYQGKVWE